MSDFATRMAGMLVGNQTSDPMSGFFMVRREVFASVIYDLSQQGYKILLDIISSSHSPLKIEEGPYVFRTRQAGESKISVMVLAEFLFLIIEKLTHGLIPPRGGRGPGGGVARSGKFTSGGGVQPDPVELRPGGDASPTQRKGSDPFD